MAGSPAIGGPLPMDDDDEATGLAADDDYHNVKSQEKHPFGTIPKDTLDEAINGGRGSVQLFLTESRVGSYVTVGDEDDEIDYEEEEIEESWDSPSVDQRNDHDAVLDWVLPQAVSTQE